MALPVAVQVYSVKSDAKADLRGTLEKIKEMGYDGVEFAGLYDHSAEDVRKMCEEIGLVPISAHVSYMLMKEDAENVFATYSAIGCKYVAVPNTPPEYRPGEEKFEEAIEDITRFGEVAKKYGIQLLYHNHDFEFVKVNGKYGLDHMYDTIPEDLLKTELDVCWVKVAGEDPAEYIRKYAGRSPVVHLKDFFGEKSEDMYELIGVETKKPERPANFEFRPVGSGLQSFPEILKAAEESGAEWVVVEQDRASMGLTPFESIKASREHLKKLGY